VPPGRRRLVVTKEPVVLLREYKVQGLQRQMTRSIMERLKSFQMETKWKFLETRPLKAGKEAFCAFLDVGYRRRKEGILSQAGDFGLNYSSEWLVPALPPDSFYGLNTCVSHKFIF
jgi:hypothetical protein